MAAVTKTENGQEFPAVAYAYVPDPEKPSTWKLRLWETPDKKATPAQVGRAVAAIGKGFRGQKVEIPEADRAAVMAKIRAAWKSVHPDMKKAEMPATLKEAATTELNQIADLVYDALMEKLRGAAAPGMAMAFGIEALFPDRAIVCTEGRYYSYPYTIADDNQVTLGAPQEVLESFDPVGSASMAEAQDDACFLEAKTADGSQWDAVLIRAGLSKNGTFYPDAVLREAVPLFEGVRIFAKADADHLKGAAKDVRNIEGWISAPRFVEGTKPDTGQIRATINLSPSPLRAKIVDAWQRGKRNLVGLSIDAEGTAAMGTA